MQVLEGHLDAQGLRFAIVVSRFNEALTSRLESGAVDCLASFALTAANSCRTDLRA